MQTLHRARFLAVFLIAALVALWLNDDGTAFPWRRRAPSSPSASSDAAGGEGFADASGGSAPAAADGGGKESSSPRIPLPYAAPDSIGGLSASPAAFEEGRERNPPPPPAPFYMRPADPSPDLSKLMEDRTREGLWLACMARQKHEDVECSAGMVEDVPAYDTASSYAVVITSPSPPPSSSPPPPTVTPPPTLPTPAARRRRCAKAKRSGPN